MTWLALKAHTVNRGGTVRLKSTNPFDRPEINFHYFDEGTDTSGEDLAAVVQSIKLARAWMHNSIGPLTELLPGSDIQSDDDLAQFVKSHAWGHHCSCSCQIGVDIAQGAVLDSQFRVHGIQNLRVVDASVFPRIPGTFIVLPIYMISEKASQLLIDEYANTL